MITFEILETSNQPMPTCLMQLLQEILSGSIKLVLIGIFYIDCMGKLWISGNT